jgi:hypothetical protein
VRGVLIVLQLVMGLGVALAPDGAMAETEQIGPYELEQVRDGLEIRSGAAFGLRGVLGVAAVLCLVAAVGLAAMVPNGVPSVVLGAVGLALALAAGRVAPGPDRLHVGATGVTVHGFVGQQGRTPAEAIRTIELQRRTPTGAETKRSPGPRVWQITLRGEGRDTVVRLRLASQAEARTLAARIGEALSCPVVERDGLAR